MSLTPYESLLSDFPGLTSSPHKLTSPFDRAYNCIAYAAGDHQKWWWPQYKAGAYWPIEPRKVTVDCFLEAFATLGYERCKHGRHRFGFEKVALYVDISVQPFKPTHMAKQSESGTWISKCGRNHDIEHALSALEGTSYGKVHMFLSRKLPSYKPNVIQKIADLIFETF